MAHWGSSLVHILHQSKAPVAIAVVEERALAVEDGSAVGTNTRIVFAWAAVAVVEPLVDTAVVA